MYDELIPATETVGLHGRDGSERGVDEAGSIIITEFHRHNRVARFHLDHKIVGAVRACYCAHPCVPRSGKRDGRYVALFERVDGRPIATKASPTFLGSRSGFGSPGW
jgi:hypothetical protein